MHKLTERTYVNADSTKIVPEGSAEAAFLLGLEGDEISAETAKRLGLDGGDEYGSMKVAELRELAEERGITVAADAKKADLVAALETSGEPAGGTTSLGSPEEAAETPA